MLHRRRQQHEPIRLQDTGKNHSIIRLKLEFADAYLDRHLLSGSVAHKALVRVIFHGSPGVLAQDGIAFAKPQQRVRVD